ncbi:MAG: NUDIX domain-containing protein, partial [Pseudomonadota bacterium]
MADIPIRSYAVSLFVLREVETRVEVLLMKREQTLVGAWCQIAGSLEDNETAWQAALREMREETGLTPLSLYSADTYEQFYEPDREAIAIFPVFVAYVASDADVTLNEEHSAFTWVNFDEAREMVSFGGQRRVLTWIEDEFVAR